MQLLSLLEDESAVTVRLAVLSLKLCMSSLSHSHHSSLAIKLLLAVMQLKQNSYWLVKVSMMSINFISVSASLWTVKSVPAGLFDILNKHLIRL